MAKVIFEFDYYEDKDIIKEHQRAIDMSCALDDIYNHIRSEFKHGSLEMSEGVERFIQEIQDMTSEFI